MAAPLVNGIAHDFTQLVPLYLGVPLNSLTNIDYDIPQEKVNNMGVGPNAVSRGRGAIDPTGSMELSMTDIEAMRAVSPDGLMVSIPMNDFVLVFGNPQFPTTHVLKNLEFSNDGISASTGDTDLKKTLNFTFSNLETLQ